MHQAGKAAVGARPSDPLAQLDSRSPCPRLTSGEAETGRMAESACGGKADLGEWAWSEPRLLCWPLPCTRLCPLSLIAGPSQAPLPEAWSQHPGEGKMVVLWVAQVTVPVENPSVSQPELFPACRGLRPR